MHEVFSLSNGLQATCCCCCAALNQTGEHVTWREEGGTHEASKALQKKERDYLGYNWVRVVRGGFRTGLFM